MNIKKRALKNTYGNKPKFAADDLVSDIIRGFLQWPTIIDCIESTKKFKKYIITFIDTRETRKAKDTEICAYSENVQTFGDRKDRQLQKLPT